MILKPPKGAMVNRGSNFARGLVGLWLMNEGGGNTIFDLSGNGNVGSLVADTHFVPGKFGSVLDFDGTGDYVEVAQKHGFSGTIGSLVFWAKINLNIGHFCNYRKGLSNQLRIQGNTEFLVVTFDGDTAIKSISFNNVTDDLYHNFVFTWNNGNLKTYQDGIDTGEIAAGAGTGIWDFSLADAFEIGRSANYFTGQIDHVMIYNRALSSIEILYLYRNPFAMFEVDL